MTVAALALAMLASAFTPGPVDEEIPSITNPLGLEGATGVLGLFEGAGMSLLLAVMVASAVSLIVRYRRSQGEERQQLKWFAYAVALLVSSVIPGTVLTGFVPALAFGQYANVLQILGVSGIPLATGIAILRYRLYDIDVVINRTLVYGALTAVLLVVYLGGVVSLQYVFRALTGQGSQLAIVASTLAIAALFNPLRRRVQALVDRRFYRRKYDARKTLEAFSATLRSETDLDRLGDELVGVVHGTVRPAHASLWLRPNSKAKTGRPADAPSED